MAAREMAVSFTGDSSDLVREAAKAEKAVDDVGKSAEDMGEHFGKGASQSAQLAGGLGDLGGALSQVGGPIGSLGTGLELLGPTIMGVTGFMDLAELASTAWAGASKLLSLALASLPFIAIGLAIAALVAGIIYAYQHSETFRNIVQDAWQTIQAVIDFAWNNVISPILDLWLLQFKLAWQAAQFLYGIVKPIFDGLADGVQAAIGLITGAIGTLISTFTSLPGDLARAASGLWDFLWQGFKAAINTVIGWWNDFEIKIDIPDWIPGAPNEIVISTPNIPKLGMGGIVLGPTLALIGERGPEAVIPLDRAGGLGSTVVNLNVNVPATANPAETGRAVAGVLRSYFAAGGRLAVPS